MFRTVCALTIAACAVISLTSPAFCVPDAATLEALHKGQAATANAAEQLDVSKGQVDAMLKDATDSVHAMKDKLSAEQKAKLEGELAKAKGEVAKSMLGGAQQLQDSQAQLEAAKNTLPAAAAAAGH